MFKVEKPMVAISVLGLLFSFSTELKAQSEGNNAISDISHGKVTIVGSTAYIDAAAFFSIGGDICVTINDILTSASGYGSYPPSPHHS